MRRVSLPLSGVVAVLLAVPARDGGRVARAMSPTERATVGPIEPGARVEYGRGRCRYAGTARAGGCWERSCKAVHVDCDNGNLHHVSRSLFAADTADARGWARVSPPRTPDKDKETDHG